MDLQACAYHKITMFFIRLPVTVSSRQNPGSQKYSPNFDWNPQSDLLKVFGVSLEMSSDPKKYFGFTFDQFIELVSVVYTAKNCLGADHLTLEGGGWVGNFWSARFFFLATWWAGNFFPSSFLCRIFFSSKKCRVYIYRM